MQPKLSLLFPCLLATACATSYTEDYRPQYHFTPAKNWMNDPNGLIYHKGKYHMYFQYNPTGDVWGNISWGHAVSDDLMRWKELPVALNAFNSPAGSLKELYYSGSAVSDDALTSGLGDGKRPPLVAVYTSHYTSDMTLPSNKSVRTGQESQSIAFSTDNGLSWTEYPDNPVILEPPSQYADEYLNFRDPFVFWYGPSKHWVMTVSLPKLHKLLIYTSKNLTAWEHVSEFGPVNAVGGQWECPSLFQLPVDGKKSRTKWVMVIGLNPGGPAHAGGSGTQYVVGTFDGTTFTADANNVYDTSAPEDNKSLPPQANWVDYGPDYYAAATYNGLSNYERVAVAWMNDWAYAVDIPTSPWRSAMSIPRVLTLETVDGRARLIQKPHLNLQTLEGRRMLYKNQWHSTRTGNLTLPVSGKALDITLTFAAGAESKMLGLNVRTDGRTYGTAIGYDFDTNEMFVNRESSGDSSFSASFPGVYYAPLPIRDGKVKLRILLDWSSVEVFGGHGEETITSQIFPSDSSTGVSLFSVGVVKDVKIEVHSVSSAWRGSY
ncbi:Levanase [Fusarium oxysporum f. sp. cubense race 1]|uniref:Levanase n=1 Tax=Fusarium oxysporum f. sp. cubense (strain race 1) TaxID=1229664 RepID=N4U3J4_FUSC1|nr:Levanase [Fusarium oxysporum f. sp. cubense race 1]